MTAILTGPIEPPEAEYSLHRQAASIVCEDSPAAEMKAASAKARSLAQSTSDEVGSVVIGASGRPVMRFALLTVTDTVRPTSEAASC